MSARLSEVWSSSTTTIGTSRTSVVAAYPSIVSWTIGAMMTMPKSRGSRRSSRNSFRMMCRTRFIALSPLPSQAQRGQAQNHHGERQHRQHLVPPRLDAHALQQNAAERHEKVAGGHDMRHHLQDRWHARNRKDESRQHQGREERRQQRHLERHLLAFRDRRDQQAKRERADEKQRDRSDQRQP